MNLGPAAFPFGVALVCAALMGYAIQRGATCMVAAVAEIAEKGSAKRLVALAEAALWVAGGLMLARALGWSMTLPGGHVLSRWSVAGGALLGLGAYINRACVFGSIAKFGSGDWAYVMTPIGFYLGVLSAPALLGPGMAVPLPTLAQGSALPEVLAIPFALFAIWRIWAIVNAGRLGTRVWAPHEATVMIAISFILLMFVVGPWTYPELLIDLARGTPHGTGWRAALLAALLAGAVAGGWSAGRLALIRPRLAELRRCLMGGAVMGWGTLLIPGGNDHLILVGMPLLWPYAWVAIGTMGLTIAVAMVLEKKGRATLCPNDASAEPGRSPR